jgi:hypothetical protein
MLKIENHCCDGAVPGYPCRGDSCPLTKVHVHYCDECGWELDDGMYDVDGKELCEDCLKEMFKVKGE